MAFDSYFYLFLFLPIAFGIYQSAKKTWLHNVVLCGASLTFYALGKAMYVPLLILISLQDYFIAHWLYKLNNQTMRKWLVATSVFSNLFILAIFKYADWFIDILASQKKHIIFLRHVKDIPHLNLMLPIGISFYVFHTISYTVDAYRRVIIPKKNILDYLTFVSFFPLLVAGPIQRARDLLPQIAQNRARASWRTIEYSLFLILFGLAKKMVFADNLGKLIDLCQGSYKSLPGSGLIIALAFTFQIYADFSAYTDIATGSAKLFNLKLTRNFITPYLSRSPSEFWQRWHICLSSWLRDYLYVPLGGNRKGAFRTYFNLLTTMILGGIWHGAGVFFLLWGIYHGLLLVFYRAVPLHTYLKKIMGKVGVLFSILIMFCSVVFGWILFLTKDIHTFSQQMSSIKQTVLHPFSLTGMSLQFFYCLSLFTIPLFILDVIGYKRNRQFVELYPAFSLVTKICFYVMMFYLVIFFGRREGYAFIYFQF
ncbi:MAG TPA: MBOAT family O-acyltransferase [Gammaproteobacteria bacterium]|nr:MBOAT family O-acyltransferase [Gammaproteobacteria bacterium]